MAGYGPDWDSLTHRPSEDQARERITAAGYADVTGLMLDDKGVWQAKATKDGKAMSVALDYQGNIVAN